MKPLFPDSETVNKERPTKITEQQEIDFYEKQAKEIIENGWSTSNTDAIITDLKELYPFNDNGYEMAKKLDDGYCKIAFYNVDTSFCEWLEFLHTEYHQVLDKNIEVWRTAHNPQPKFVKGQKLIVDITLNHEKEKGCEIFITGFLEKTAHYLVDQDPERKGGTIIAYEIIEERCSPIN